MTFSEVTGYVRVLATPSALAARSAPEENRFAFAYTIRIENHGPELVQLLSRRWLITDARGLTQEVVGDGVVGVQPLLPPGAAFEYTSGAVIATPSGVMVGSYAMLEPASGRRFEVAIPAFALEQTTGPAPLAH